jgi:F-box interacting protein
MDIPTDVLVEILKRLPWTSRRRLRLVCRSWRNLIHQRTDEMKQCRDAVPLVVTTESAYLLYDLDSSKTCTPRELWPSGGPYKHMEMEVVGVCNGVLCLCDDAVPGGAITLVNPATDDVLALPPIPRSVKRSNTRRSSRGWHQAYRIQLRSGTTMGRGSTRWCTSRASSRPGTRSRVFTLGEASWREIPAAAAKCKLEAGIVSVNGTTYWVTESEGWERIMSFDLESEKVTGTKPLPKSARDKPIRHLSEVQRRLGIAVATSDAINMRYYGRGYGCIEVFILQ